MSESYPLYLIVLLPFLGAALNLLFGRRLGNGVVSLIACGAVAGAALVATKAVWILAHDLPSKGMLVDQFFDPPTQGGIFLPKFSDLVGDQRIAIYPPPAVAASTCVGAEFAGLDAVLDGVDSTAEEPRGFARRDCRA